MSMPTVQLSDVGHQILTELAEQTGQTAMAVLDKALDDYRRKLFLEKLNADYAELRADPKAWAEWQEEIHSMDGCLMDGLDPNERWGEDGDLIPPEREKADG